MARPLEELQGMVGARHLVLVAMLLGVASLVQVMVIHRASVPALDAVRFVQFAQEIERDGLWPTLREQWQQPLYPVWLYLVYQVLQSAVGPFTSLWAVSAQLAAAIPLVLALPPLYFMLRRLVGIAGAVAGSLLFCILPEVAQLGADGISDSTHLLWLCLACWAIVEYLERSAVGMEADDAENRRRKALCSLPCRLQPWLGLAGVATALALLTRVEALVLPPALAFSLLRRASLRTRRSWIELLMGIGCYWFGLAMVLGPYLVATGSLTPSLALSRVLGRPPLSHRVSESSVQSPALAPSRGQPPIAEAWCFDRKEYGQTIRQRGYWAAAHRFSASLLQAYGYWPGLLALAGAWRLRRRWRLPAHRFMQVFFGLFSVAVLHFVAREGYLAARHLLPLVILGIGSAGHEAAVLIQGAARAADRGLARWLSRAASLSDSASVRWAVVVIACVAVGLACIPTVLMRPHATHLGHREAGLWLAHQADLTGTVLDTRGWTGLYSGRRTFLYEDALTAFRDPELRYLVVEEVETHPSSLRADTLRRLCRVAGAPVARFPDALLEGSLGRSVVIYRWRRGISPGPSLDGLASSSGTVKTTAAEPLVHSPIHLSRY